MGYKVKAGKNYLKKFEEYIYEDGTYTFQILNAKSTNGNVTFTLGTSDGHKLFKTYFTKSKSTGAVNERAVRDVSALVTTAMQIEDDEVSVDLGDCIGFYVQAKVVNNYYEYENEQRHIVYLNDITNADGFPDGTPSLLSEAQQRMIARKAAKANASAPEEVEEVEEVEEESEESGDPLMDFLGL